MKRALQAVVAVVAVQAVLLGVWWAVERARAPAQGFDWTQVEGAAPPLELVRAEETVPLPEGTHLVHFWATWCAPCQEELPELIEAAENEGVPLLAVTDEPWSVLEAWFEGEVPAVVVRDPTGGAADLWGVRTLPDTWVVSAGALDGHVRGARSWAQPAARDFLRGLR